MRIPSPWLAIPVVLVLATSCATAPPSGSAKPAPAAPAAAEKPAQPAAPPEVTTPSGLKIQDLVVGNGPMAEDGMTVTVNYTGWLTDGTKFDSSHDPGRQPLRFTIGQGTVIRGWEEGVKGMRVGGRRRLTIPPEMAYGEQGYPGAIPPNSTLIFEIEFLGLGGK